MSKITLDYVLSIMEESNEYAQTKATNERYQQFVRDRMAGAKKIITQSERKSGVARLTTTHFKAKIPIYEKALKLLTGNKPLKSLKSSYLQTVGKLRKNIRQPKQFQKLTGELEALGEILIYTKNM